MFKILLIMMNHLKERQGINIMKIKNLIIILIILFTLTGCGDINYFGCYQKDKDSVKQKI